MRYCEEIHKTKRLKTRQVMVGNVGVGGDNPVRIQSMTTSSTRDVDATVEQIIRLSDAGCEIVRLTVQGMKEADACEDIKNALTRRGYDIPLVADIHFFPPAAMRVVEFVDKVRVNPGNFVDKRAQFKTIEYDDATYAEELEKIEVKFGPLVDKCKQLGRAMRIGTNHGSLSDRIMNRYGDTPRGMVESALEFTRVARAHDYHDLIFSMKASNPKVMIEAYRLLVAEFMKLGWDYPLHLGVTEAGEGEDGRIKSAMGIGSLLLDGIGDTIRVSLTEDPWHEIDPCKRLVALGESYVGRGIAPFEEKHRKITEHEHRAVEYPKSVAMHRDGSVFVAVTENEIIDSGFYEAIGCRTELGQPKIDLASADGVVVRETVTDAAATKKLRKLLEIGIGVMMTDPLPGATRVVELADAIRERSKADKAALFAVELGAPKVEPIAVVVTGDSTEEWDALKAMHPALVLLAPTESRHHTARRFFEWMQEVDLKAPVILNFTYACGSEDLPIHAAAECGVLLTDELGEGVLIESQTPISALRLMSFNILQGARMRSFKTDFISCPSCGRTLFDLQEVSERIRQRTGHLPGVKVAIMGCIVNGPGEMADADFGYVGSRPGKIDLYVGKECVERNIEMDEADERLIELIKTHGRWVEPAAESGIETATADQ